MFPRLDTVASDAVVALFESSIATSSDGFVPEVFAGVDCGVFLGLLAAS